ncbi:23S rRNA pseudouridine1911/1915/1917 synthase [Nitrospirillum iridis]|uniref:Pseudouridine synthase n=2 Tax=Nitrospirillum iridis TaxID=765888 RepID=A0A7X0AY73_9PROT|nr:23S rRNA pseudouridine1911/1915/1917 synthase [Nitrospirillum iridis]
MSALASTICAASGQPADPAFARLSATAGEGGADRLDLRAPVVDAADDEDMDGEEAGSALFAVTIPDTAARDRLDKALAQLVPEAAGLTRSRLQALIGEGRVALGQPGGQTIDDTSYRVKPGQVFQISVPAPEPAVPVAQDIPLTIVYEDDDLLVIDKAAGMVVHPAAGNPDGTLVNALLHHCGDRLSGIGGVRRPGIVHRLDKDTSGLMVVAKSDRAHSGLSAQFADRTLSRTYQAVVWGSPAVGQGEVEGNVGRHPTDRKRMAVVGKGGKPALTRWRVLSRYGLLAAHVECKLATGRTHQIRVHMAEIGHPLVGDPLYGKARPTGALGARLKEATPAAQAGLLGFRRQALHAKDIAFRHPVSGEMLGFSSALPADLAGLIFSLE